MENLVRLLVLIAVFVFTFPIWPQSLVSGDLAGDVVDASGAALLRASLTLRNTDSGEVFTSVTNGTGAYRFPLLKPGPYELTVTASGFG